MTEDQSSSDPLAFQLFNEIGIIEHLSRNAFASVLPTGMTIAQFTVLNHFVRLGHTERSPADLASAFQLTRATMTSTLARMERNGLVTIRPDPHDGRAKLVSPTPAGRQMRERCIAALGPLLVEFGSYAEAAQIEAILPLLRRIRTALDAARDPA